MPRLSEGPADMMSGMASSDYKYVVLGGQTAGYAAADIVKRGVSKGKCCLFSLQLLQLLLVAIKGY